MATRIARVLESAIGWDGYRIFGLDPATMLVNRLLAASENDAEARLEWIREVYLTMPTPYAELPVLAHNRRRGVAYQEHQDTCWGFAPRDLAGVDAGTHYREYHETRSPVGGTLLSIFHDRDRPVAAMQAYRRDPKRQFRPSDVSLMHAVNPIVGSAIAAAAIREAATIGETTSESPSGIVLVQASGAVQFATPAGERWLDLLGRDDHGLPTAFWSAMAARRNAGVDESIVLSVLAEGRPVRIEATSGGAEGLTAVVIADATPPGRPEIPGIWGLTPRERQVVTEVVAGRTNAQIADALFVSQHTVEWHLGSIYDKVGVSSRQGLVAAVFRTTLLPGIEDDIVRQAS
ncbi:MAG TPA: LuxR C-terminal-related transcriptional regulator [Thermomicrobiales bacterium]|nr:LuxR C-terminal-related transcriptional regulator [Thermomicrobiales bacterium]